MSDLPAELVGQAPLVAVFLWAALQAKREILDRFDRVSVRVDEVRDELRDLRIDLAMKAGEPPPPSTRGRLNGRGA